MLQNLKWPACTWRGNAIFLGIHPRVLRISCSYYSAELNLKIGAELSLTNMGCNCLLVGGGCSNCGALSWVMGGGDGQKWWSLYIRGGQAFWQEGQSYLLVPGEEMRGYLPSSDIESGVRGGNEFICQIWKSLQKLIEMLFIWLHLTEITYNIHENYNTGM